MEMVHPMSWIYDHILRMERTLSDTGRSVIHAVHHCSDDVIVEVFHFTVSCFLGAATYSLTQYQGHSWEESITLSGWTVSIALGFFAQARNP
ncbi:MAG: hypothetical protein A3F09_02845 [Chlamydiae bacterium RIFCSPHIGHO2_12_FULL_49_11]|nr:MAG: hypothetical protein A3F09_02845 [Chlamydiae bacterium RIFCSPHIGHO2_12_FULL_49_11]